MNKKGGKKDLMIKLIIYNQIVSHKPLNAVHIHIIEFNLFIKNIFTKKGEV